jgi:hypothetical protein
MTAHWKDGTDTWVCSHAHEHTESERFCTAQEPREARPPRLVAVPSAPVEVAREAFRLSLPNGLRVRVDGDLTIGRGLDSIVGLSLLQFADVSRAHLDVRYDDDGVLRFAPLKPSRHAPVYYYDLPEPGRLSVDSLTAVRPRLVEPGDPRLDELDLERGGAAARVFGLGQHCMIKFDWGTETP